MCGYFIEVFMVQPATRLHRRLLPLICATITLLSQAATLEARSLAPHIDSDGDGIPDSDDHLPLIATVPLHWSVAALKLRLPDATSTGTSWGTTNELTLYSRAATALPHGSCKGANATAAPFDWLEADGFRGYPLAAMGLFGSGVPPWGLLQRLAAESFLANPAARQQGVELLVEVHFRNLSDTDWVIKQLAVPLEAGGRRLAVAYPTATELYERGIAFPATAAPKVYGVSFTARIPHERIAELTRALTHDAPNFAFEQGAGLLFPAATPEGEQLSSWFAPILSRTVAITIQSGHGEILVWRVARKLAGKQQRVADWAAAMNVVSLELHKRPFWLSDEGYLLSLAGWDNGAWEQWWQINLKRLQPDGWEGAPLKRDVTFKLSQTTPTLSRRTAEQLEALAADPIVATLLAQQAAGSGDMEAALAWLTPAAAAAYPPALTQLAGLLQASGDKRDTTAVIGQLQAAATRHYAPAQEALGRALLRGAGVTANRDLAFGWLSQAAAQGHPEASAAHAICQIRGFGTPADPVGGMSTLRQAAWRGSATAQFALGLQLLEAEESEGIDWMHLAAEAGYAKAQVRYARILGSAADASRDPVAAARWNLAAAEQGEVEAQLAYGLALRQGNGVRRDLPQATFWLRRAAAQGNSEAQMWLALALLRSRSRPEERSEGVTWLHQAAGQGHPQAQLLLGRCYSGFGGFVEQDHAAAYRWYQAAAEQQLIPARLYLALCHYHGLGTALDKQKAFAEFAQAAAAESAEAQIWLAYCYINGEGVEIDLDEAQKWAQRALRQGHPAGRQILRAIPKR